MAEIEAEMREVIQSWKDWHRKLSESLGAPYLERNVTLNAAKELRAKVAELEQELEKWKSANLYPATYREAVERVVEFEQKFPCGHRKIDWDDSYGECVACKIHERADDYEKLPLTIIECHDQIAELEQELGVGRELVAAQLKAIEIVESQLAAERQSVMNLTDRLGKLQASEMGLQNQLAAERADNADLSEGIDGMIQDRDYFEGKLKAAEAEIAKLKDSNIRLSEARSRWR